MSPRKLHEPHLILPLHEVEEWTSSDPWKDFDQGELEILSTWDDSQFYEIIKKYMKSFYICNSVRDAGLEDPKVHISNASMRNTFTIILNLSNMAKIQLAKRKSKS
jgi:hypothetical protein